MARSFTSGDYLDIATGGGEYDLSVGSISYWMNTSQAQNYNGLLTRQTSALGGRPGLASFINSSTGSEFRVQCKNATVEVANLIGTTNIRDGADHHCGFVFRQANGANNRIYVDGVEEANADNTAAWTWPAQPIRMGVFIDTFWTNYTGIFGELGIWNVALDAVEWAALAKGVSPLLIRPQGLVGYWPLIRGLKNRFAGDNMTASGTSIVSHFPIIYPARPQIYAVPTVGGGGGTLLDIERASMRGSNRGIMRGV